MKPSLSLFVFIDACGWEIIKDRPFVKAFAPHRHRLRSTFGFSSACIPSILSGRPPAEHRNWCYFVYDPARSPFRHLRWLGWLPKALTGRRRFRSLLSRALRRPMKFRGYFDLYNLPFEHIGLFDFSEKKNPLAPGGLNAAPNIFDYLEERGVDYHVSDPARTEKQSLMALQEDIAAERIDQAFLYWPDLDGLLHCVGNQSPEIDPQLSRYEQWLESLQAVARRHYRDVKLYIFSDHGMANCDRHVDLRATIEQLPLRFGVDYAAVYDSTMARFWFFRESACNLIAQALRQVPSGRILPDSELAQLGTLFPDRYFGEMIFLMQEGTLIVPSHMGERPIRAMHGYHPDDPHSYAALMTNQRDLPLRPNAITDIYHLMVHDAEKSRRLAAEAKTSGPVPRTSPRREPLIAAVQSEPAVQMK